MKLSNLKTIVYVGLALFYLYIIAMNVFRNVEGMTTTIETIENKKEGGPVDTGDSEDTTDNGKKEEGKSASKKEGDTNVENSDSGAKPDLKKESTDKKKNEDKPVSTPMEPSTGNSSNKGK
jgi:hypothetical protein